MNHLSLQPGEHVPPCFQVVRPLAQGGMGAVYLAHDLGRGVHVALKVLDLPGLSPDDVARFQREAQLTAAVDDHPGIVRVHHAGVHRGLPFIVMQLVDGQDLARTFEREPLIPHDLVRIVADVARALAACHARGIVHRDIKPGNVLLSLPEGHARLTDFGLARSTACQRLTRTGALLGTPAYMAPEQAADPVRAVAPPVDVYSLGAVLYHGLTGHPPFAGTPYQVLTAAQAGPPPPPSSEVDIDPALDHLCMSTLQSDPARRPTADALALALEAYLRGERPSPTRRWPLPLAALILLLALAGWGGSRWAHGVVDRERAARTTWERSPAATSGAWGALPSDLERRLTQLQLASRWVDADAEATLAWLSACAQVRHPSGSVRRDPHASELELAAAVHAALQSNDPARARLYLRALPAVPTRPQTVTAELRLLSPGPIGPILERAAVWDAAFPDAEWIAAPVDAALAAAWKRELDAKGRRALHEPWRPGDLERWGRDACRAVKRAWLEELSSQPERWTLSDLGRLRALLESAPSIELPELAAQHLRLYAEAFLGTIQLESNPAVWGWERTLYRDLGVDCALPGTTMQQLRSAWGVQSEWIDAETLEMFIRRGVRFEEGWSLTRFEQHGVQIHRKPDVWTPGQWEFLRFSRLYVQTHRTSAEVIREARQLLRADPTFVAPTFLAEVRVAHALACLAQSRPEEIDEASLRQAGALLQEVPSLLTEWGKALTTLLLERGDRRGAGDVAHGVLEVVEQAWDTQEESARSDLFAHSKPLVFDFVPVWLAEGERARARRWLRVLLEWGIVERDRVVEFRLYGIQALEAGGDEEGAAELEAALRARVRGG